ncbi:MAG TPA: hypothetical protein VIV34_12205 [Pseudolabrys sp.]
MPREIGFRVQIALLFYSTINIVLFTAAVYAVTLFPPLTPNAGLWITAFAAASLIVTAPVAWCVGRCLPATWQKNIVATPSPLAGVPSRDV